MTPWWFCFLCFLCFLAAADRHEELSCRAARCHWRCDAERSSQDEAEIRCPVSSFGSQQNSFHSPRMASQQDRQRLRFRFKGDLELFALVSDSSEWISLWKSHAQQDWAATVLLLPSARALRFTGQGVLGDILAEQHHDSGRRLGASWSPWTQVQFSYGPSKRRWHTAVLDDAGKMWIFAGDDDGELLNDLWYYDTVALDGWVQAQGNGSWPSPRFSHMAVMQGGKMWVFGGVVQSGLSKELWNYDMERGNWIGWSNLEGPTARESMTLVEGDGKLWMFGGYDGSIRSDLWCLTAGGDPLWTLISTGLVKPSGRYSHVAVQEAGKMWIFGGLTEAGLQADLWYFDISTFIWTYDSREATASQLDRNGDGIPDLIIDKIRELEEVKCYSLEVDQLADAMCASWLPVTDVLEGIQTDLCAKVASFK